LPLRAYAQLFSSIVALLAALPAVLFAGNPGQCAAGGANPCTQVAGTTAHDIRIVWVLSNAQSVSEVGPIAGSAEVVLYEMECIGDRLGAVKRTYNDAHLKYGSRTFAVRLNRSPLSAEGANALTAALERECQSQPAASPSAPPSSAG
jgi:hypothetical protein